MLDVCLLGCGGMMPLPKRYLTSLMLRYNGNSILTDCGEGTQVALKRTGWSPKNVGLILFTHFHADHISGLPGFLLTMGNAERTEPLLIAGPRGLARVVSALLIIAPELPFEIRLKELEGDSTFVYEGVRIKAFRVRHNISCFGYSFEIDRKGKFNPERAKELDIPVNYWKVLQNGGTVKTEDGRRFTPDQVMGAARKGIKVTYTTDTRPCDNIIKYAEKSDLFICEGMYGEDDKIEKAKEHKHMTFSEAARLARDAGVKKLWLTHYSPSLVNPKEFMGYAKKIFPESYPGKDGLITELNYEDEEESGHE
ncbi:MAG: ribonuclease Z [Lachnospiraceae bacterium]|nr:ribonuclease Z [Lachnospiraceae bacterium]